MVQAMNTTPAGIRFYVLIGFLVQLMLGSGGAVNSLSIRKDFTHGSHPGYIDEAILVVEPMVGYASISLFLTYSDHGRLSGDVEVVHSFELPQGAIVNDLWLWFDDSIMQAKVYELPRAQFLYDSITAFKRDPAFLKVNHGQYQFHIFPLRSGKFRKVKLTMQIPITWYGSQPRVTLPLELLRSNNLDKKPLKILLRTGSMACDSLFILGAPDIGFSETIDTLGYEYREAFLPDVGPLQRLDLTFRPSFINGSMSYATGNADGNRFSFGFDPAAFFSLPGMGIRKRKTVVGLDVSGNYEPDMLALPSQLQGLLSAMSGPGDSLRLVVTGEGKMESYPTSGWSSAGSPGIQTILEGFQEGGIYNARKSKTLPRLLMADREADHGWAFSGLDKVATLVPSAKTGIMSALAGFRDADLVASYTQGFEEKLTDADAKVVLDTLASFLDRGGWFLTYIDFNRKQEKIATSLIKGLRIPEAFQTTTLSGVPGTPIGRGLPAAMHHKTNNPLISTDGDITVEMVDEWKRPVVISKRIGKGRLVVSGVWSNNDPDGVKKSMSMALLGLQLYSSNSQLKELLDKVASEQSLGKADRILLLSNSDSSINAAGAASGTAEFMDKLAAPRPQLDAVNLLSGRIYTPTTVSHQGETYLGSGLLLKLLADGANGQYFPGNTKPWPQIIESLSPKSNPEPISLEWTVSPPSLPAPEGYEMGPVPGDPDKPRFFIGTAGPGDSVRLSFKARFRGFDSIFSAGAAFPISKDTPLFGNALDVVLAGEAITRIVRGSVIDTARLVGLALNNGIVTDYTALLALEPNDTLHFMKAPNDESQIGTKETTRLAGGNSLDTLGISATFSPSENRWRYSVSVPARGKVELSIYDLMGRKIFGISRSVMSKGTYSFTGNQMIGTVNPREKLNIAFLRFSPSSPLGVKKELVRISRLMR
jgi:hypothetical protein